MTKRTRIKICGVTEPETLALLVELGVDAFGMMFYEKSKRALSLAQARRLVANPTDALDSVAVFVNPSYKEVAGIVDAIPISLLQFHGDEPDDFCHQFGLPYIKAIRCHDYTNFDAVIEDYPHAARLLLDSEVNGQFGGTGQAFDWHAIPSSLNNYCILAGGLNAENVEEAISIVHPYAVDVSGGVENTMGKKDHKKITSFVEAVKRVNQHDA